ncbi:ribokinase [Herbaspirillum seropedicae]|uniref:Ribokinase n=1 Tax=Herbaspirillum seropedicae (strain SmR1) TaxID=757424 RepID=D8IUD4_HERSS|nr:ribokinase [Herbaspirillum seropedicae]ADJ63796.1 sugar kinase protein [Herbaspirillum seropedicae SmR1]AKN65806.1 ribokinase [Herbaspirillum seropedicae]AON54633.1 sugar kinase [Herbaspirillum seropedicae]NQE28962.1 ribokinase [Herbaspirillum seropedicae]UMU21776.1 ribokinase [Herbaspirillum seropedicae]
MIVIIGSVNMDLVLRVPRMPLPGETLAGDRFMTIPGGKGANQAVACARLAAPGTRVAMVACVGDDAFGGQMRQSITACGIDDRYIDEVAGEATGIASIMVDANAQNSIVIAAGANGRLDVERIERARALIEQASIVLLQLEVPMATVIHSIELAHALGKTVVLNPAPAQALPRALLQKIDYLILNEIEAAMLAEEQSEDIPMLARKLHDLGARNVVVTLGEKGVYGSFADGQQRHLPARKVQAVDTTAAGDTFIGGFIGAIAQGRDQFEAIAYAQAAAALSVTRVGAQTSIPTRDEVVL